jgi:hypothetical protein
MADNKGYEVLVDELTVHKAVRPLTHPITGDSMGWQQGAGETWFMGEVIPPESINPEWAEALDSGEGDLFEALSDKLKPSSGEPALNEAYRMGLPFEGYDDMDEDDILDAMRVLPSAAVQRMKDWERQNQGRPSIVHYNIGFGESPDDRQSGRLSQEEDAELDENKPVRRIQTRQFEDGQVTPGEGITGTGDPQVAPGTAAEQEESGDEGSPKGNQSGDTKLRGGGRAGRRPRPQPKTEAGSPPDESGSGESSS